VPTGLWLPRNHPQQKPVLGTTLNGAHPLARGLGAYWALNEGGGAFVGSATQHPAPTSPLGAGVATPTWAGGGISFAGQQLISVANDPSIQTNQFSLFAGIVPASFGGTHDSNSVFAFGRYSFYISVGTGAVCLFTNSAGSWVDGTRQMAVGQQHVVGATKDATKRNVYLNGAWDNSSPDAGAIPYDTSGGMIGNRPDAANPTTQFNGLILWVGWWTRALSPAEIQQLYLDPYAPYQPQRRVWATGAAAALVSPPTTTGQGGSTGALAASVAAPVTAQGGAAGVAIPSVGVQATGPGGARGGAVPLLAEPATGQAGAGGSVSPTLAPPAATTAAGGQGLASPTLSVPATAGGGAQGSASPVVTTPATGQGGAAGSAVASGQATGSAVGMAGAAGVASPTVSPPPATGGGGAQAATTPTIGGAAVAGQAGDQSMASPSVTASATGQAGAQGSVIPIVAAAGGVDEGGAQGSALAQTGASATGQAGSTGAVTGASVAQPTTGQSGGQGAASGTAQAPGAATGQAGVGGSVSPSVGAPAAGQAGAAGQVSLRLTDPSVGQGGSQGQVAAPSIAPTAATGQGGTAGSAAAVTVTTPPSAGTPVRLRAAAAWRSHAAAAAWRSHTYSMQLGGPVTLTPLTPDAAGLNPGDANSPLTVRVDGLPQGAVIAAVSAAATVRALGLSGAQPAPTFIRAPAPVWTGNVITLTVGDGAGIDGARYSLDIGVQVGAEWQHGALVIACGGNK
jgi:hypothetical protein